MAKTNQKAKMALDVVLTLLIVFEMFIQYTGNFLHEVMGFVFFATIVTHLALSSAWMKSTAQAISKGKLSGRRRTKLVLNTALAAVMVVLVASSLAISDILYQAGFVMPGAYEVWDVLHTMSSYMLCALVVTHLALHWASMASAFHVPYNPARRQAIGSGVQAAAALGMIALGVNGGRAILLNQAPAANGQESVNAEGASSGAQAGQAPSAAQNQATGSVESQVPGAAQNQIPSGSVNNTPYSAPQAPDQAGEAGYRKGKGHGKQRMEGSPAEGAAPGNAQGNEADSAAPESYAEPEAPLQEDYAAPESDWGAQDSWDAPSQDSWSNTWDSTQDSQGSATTGVCTLCRKYCSFSNLRCDRPYREGLL